MLFTIRALTQYEASQVGITWDNIWSEYEHFSVGHGFTMFAIDFFYLLIIGLYLDVVLPKPYGIQRSIFFCLQPSYWCGTTKNKVQDQKKRAGQLSISETGMHSIIDEIAKFETKNMHADCYEKVSQFSAQKDQEGKTLVIDDLRKQFPNGVKAVDGINLKLFADQIFCLLGHNGAGKTTTISMLTGMLESTQGDVKLFGQDLFTNLDHARADMGVCPQHDVLFNFLTVEEHLKVFYEFKGGPGGNAK